MSTVDFFDLNSAGSDSHLQFMNWSMVNNGAYDYAQDHGYTYGLVAEYYDGAFAARFGEMLMPTVANGIKLDWDDTAPAAKISEQLLPGSAAKAAGVVWRWHSSAMPIWAAIGKPSTAILWAERGSRYHALPAAGRVKYGFGLNAEQELTHLWRAFGRLGWNINWRIVCLY